MPFEVTDHAKEIRLAFQFAPKLHPAIEQLEIIPDPLSSLQNWGDIARVIAMQKTITTNISPGHYRPLLRWGDRAAGRASYEEAFRNYCMAADLRPDQATPWEKIEAIKTKLAPEQLDGVREKLYAYEQTKQPREFHPCQVDFEKGIHLEGVRRRETEVKRGGSLGLNFYWSLQKKYSRVAQTAIWIHFVDSRGKVVFQGDHEFVKSLSRKRDTTEFMPDFQEITVPSGVPPGTYSIRFGLNLPANDKRLKIRSSDWSRTENSVMLPWTIEVKE